MFCPKCGEPMIVSDKQIKPLSWCVCPKDGYSNYTVLCFLKNYNTSLKDVLENPDRNLPMGTTLEDLKTADVAQYCRHKIGAVQGWTLEQYMKYGKQLDDGEVKPYREPPFLVVCQKFLDTTKDYMTCVSTKDMSLGKPIGINVPVFQEQAQFVGHCALFQDRKESFAWKTYLLNIYACRPKGFLAYRPQRVTSAHEIVLVDNFTAYLQMTYWYDTARQENSKVFPYRVVPVLALGKMDVALNYLFDYFWNPARITLASPRIDTRTILWDKIQEPSRLQCERVRIMLSPNNTARQFKACRNRREFEDIVDTQFYEMRMDYDEYKLKTLKDDWL